MESKHGNESKHSSGADDHEEHVITPEKITIGTGCNNCPVEAGLQFDVEFALNRSVVDGHWEIKYLVDSIRKRNIIGLGATKRTRYESGSCSFSFSVDRVDVSSVKRSALSNAGLLICTLVDDETGEELVDLKMVVQVQEGSSGEMTRFIYNPLE